MESQFVSFEIGDATFLIPIERVVEFRTWSEPTAVPHTPAYVRGIVNIRGEIVPIYDVSARLGKGGTQAGSRHVVVIVRGNDGRSVGLLVDAVSEVVEIAADMIEPPPNFGATVRRDFIRGMGKYGGRFVILLEPDRAFDVEEMAAICAATPEAALA